MQQRTNEVSTLISEMKSFSGSTRGVRIIANLHSKKTAQLVEFQAFKRFLENETRKYEGLNKSAEFYFNFPHEGFAAIDCFSKSHISVRTSPGINDIIFDLFLSNDLPDNHAMSESIYQSTIAFFESRVVQEKIRIVG